MATTTIDQLPVEILMECFRYLPQNDALTLVNKQFYNAACAVNDSKNWMKFSSIFLENEVDHQWIMYSIEKTSRKIRKLHLDLGVVIDSMTNNRLRESATSDAIDIVKKFSSTIKYFRLDDAWIEISEFSEILSSLPEVEHLILENLFEKPQIKRQRRSDGILQLHQLKTLTLNGCDSKFRVAFESLQADILHKLTIKRRNLELDSLTGLLMRQTNIKQLTLIGNMSVSMISLPVSVEIFDELKLESLELQQKEFNSNYATILSKQTKLKSLILRQGKVDDDVLNVITNELTELETLHLNVGDTSTIENIVKLTKLTDLTLGISSLESIDRLAGVNNSQITSLKICRHGYKPNTEFRTNQIGALAKSVPALKVLRIDTFLIWKTFSAITRYFNFIEVLEVNFRNLHDFNNSINDCYFNPNLIELKIEIPLNVKIDAVLKKLIFAYPNLKKLHFGSWTPITRSHFKHMLDGFEKMESMILCCSKWNTNRHERCFEPKEHMEKFGGAFDVMYYEGKQLHMKNRKMNRSYVQ